MKHYAFPHKVVLKITFIKIFIKYIFELFLHL